MEKLPKYDTYFSRWITTKKIYAKNIPILPKIVVKFSILKTKKSDQIWWGFKQTLIMRCIVLFQDILARRRRCQVPIISLLPLWNIFQAPSNLCSFSKEKHERNVKIYICMCLFRKNITQIQKQPKSFFKKFAKNKKIRSFLKVPLSLTLQSTNINIIIFLKINKKASAIFFCIRLYLLCKSFAKHNMSLVICLVMSLS